jgi:hypothetical protein
MIGTETRSSIQIANERLSIVTALRQAGAEASDFGGKQFCPFGHMYHADGGYDKALRVYTESNTAYCFAGCGYFSPVKLIALAKDIDEQDAAEYILELTGYVAPTLDSLWEHANRDPRKVDHGALTDALKLACSRMSPDWEERQLDDDVATRFRKCLALLPKVRTEQDAETWLSNTKKIMRKALTP